VRNQVAQFGAQSIVLNCYRSPNFPNDPLCQLFSRQTNPTASNFQGIGLINNSYVNISRQEFRSIDLTAQYNHEFDWARMRTRQTLGQPLRDFNGEVLTPDFVGNGSVRFDRGPWRVTWSFDLVGKASDTETAIDETVSTARGPNQTTPGINLDLLQRISFINNVGFKHYHHLSVRYRLDDDTLATVGVRNLFDRPSPVFSNSGNETRIGSALLSSQYDLIGRRLFVDVTKRF
jgi:iron complex outermembrane recepter protein